MLRCTPGADGRSPVADGGCEVHSGVNTREPDGGRMTRTRKLIGAASLLVLAACPIPRELREQRPLPVNTQFSESVNGLQRRLTDPTTVILHVGRTRAEYDAGHIPGARFLALSSIVTERDGLPNELPATDAPR